MPGASAVASGNELFDMMIYLPSVVVPNVGANATASQTVTVSGVVVGDLISWNQQGVIVGLSVDNVYVSAANTLSFYWSNTTGSPINSSANQAFILSINRANIVPYTTLPNGVY